MSDQGPSDSELQEMFAEMIESSPLDVLGESYEIFEPLDESQLEFNFTGGSEE